MTDDATFVEIQQIRAELAAQGGILRTLLHAQGSKLAADILDEMRKDEVLAQVFLRVDGMKAQKDIVADLVAAGVRGSSQPNVSGKMRRLSEELGLIYPVRRTRNGVVYQMTPAADALRIRQGLQTKARRNGK